MNVFSRNNSTLTLISTPDENRLDDIVVVVVVPEWIPIRWSTHEHKSYVYDVSIQCPIEIYWVHFEWILNSITFSVWIIEIEICEQTNAFSCDSFGCECEFWKRMVWARVARCVGIYLYVRGQGIVVGQLVECIDKIEEKGCWQFKANRHLQIIIAIVIIPWKDRQQFLLSLVHSIRAADVTIAIAIVAVAAVLSIPLFYLCRFFAVLQPSIANEFDGKWLNASDE